MENVENPFVLIKKKKKKSAKNGHQMVDVDLIPLEPLHIYCNNIFVLQIYIHSQFCTNYKHTYIFSPSKHQFHDYFWITIICTPKYHVKNYK
jgi:hypothetical protein